MKKKAIVFVSLAAAMLVLLVVYAGSKNKPQTPVENEDTSYEVMSAGQFALSDYELGDLSGLEVSNESGGLVFDIKEDEFGIKNADMSLLDTQKIMMEANNLIRISSDNEVEKQPDAQSLEKYGLDEKNVKAYVRYTEKDGTEKEIKLGDPTPDGLYYYAFADGSVYTVGKTTGESIQKNVTDLADLSMQAIDPNGVATLEIKQKGREDLIVDFEKDNGLTDSNLEKNGLQTLVMHSPIEDLLVYPYNIETGLLYNYDKFGLEKMVEASDENFDKYGLADPTMTIFIADLENQVALKVGNETEDKEGYYVAPYANKAVYTMSKAAIDPFFDYDIIDFIQKFVALHYRYDLSGFDITSVYGDYKVEFREEGEKTISEKNGRKKDERQEYINGKAVDSEKFVDYYELIVGLTFDALDEEQPSGDVKAEITYHLLDGTEDVIRFYDHDDNFFTAVKEGGSGKLNMLISKQQVKAAFDKAKELA